MFRKIVAAAAIASLMGVTPAMAASTCRNAQGKFIKCQTAPVKKKAAPANVAKGKDGKCRFSSGPKKGQFTKCS
ncbi:hypothetical protein [Novosphingobium clariflavum]|uniref:PsiF repeat-containing protein n=1 Tax=Novosphingobium clariflavum TaxID=2029884 RepID=A0ABV6SAQ5_9SPHN|nr:hypothetical protein [Novosphingobium clariflavum]